MTINPYLNFPGTTEAAFNFYKSVFGGEFSTLQRFKETPDGDKLSAALQEQIMHVSLPIAPGYILMATDAPAEMGFTLQQGNNYYIAISPDSKEEAERLYNGLSAGGKIEMELQDTFWGAYYGSFTDKFGIGWMINYAKR
ncbi:MAG: VOC family protein [Chitinophagaceae bacterium]